MFESINLKSSKRTEFINITNIISASVQKSGVKSGLCVLHVPHTTAAITLNESADPDVVFDIIKKTGELIPENNQYLHLEGNSDAHIKSSIFGTSLSLIIENNGILLGTWQNIYFCEFDGPRTRTLYIKILQ